MDGLSVFSVLSLPFIPQIQKKLANTTLDVIAGCFEWPFDDELMNEIGDSNTSSDGCADTDVYIANGVDDETVGSLSPPRFKRAGHSFVFVRCTVRPTSRRNAFSS